MNPLDQFNAACRAASSHTTEQVRQAQDFFKHFRESSTVLTDCRYVLEQGAALSQFHAARLLGEAAVVRWKQLDVTSQRALREYLFQWVCQRSGVSGPGADPVERAARTTGAKAFAVITKRGWAELKDVEVQTLLSQWCELCVNPQQM